MSVTQRFIWIDFFKDLFNRLPITAVIVYGAACGLQAFFIFLSIRDFIQIPSKPIPATFLKASAQAETKTVWAIIPNLKRDCSRVLKLEDDYLIPLISESGELVLYSPEINERSCDSKDGSPVRGVLERINSRRMYDLQKKNYRILTVFPENKIWTLCGYCSPSNSLWMLIFFIPLFLVLGYGFYGSLKQYLKN